MRDQFYVVLPSNSSMQYFAENTTTHFVTKLPKEVQLHGDWVVALTEIQIPLTFQHLSDDKIDRTVWVETATSEYASRTPNQIVNITGLELQAEGDCLVNPGIYSSVDSVVDEVNNLKCVKNHSTTSENVTLTHDQFDDITGLEFQSEGESRRL